MTSVELPNKIRHSVVTNMCYTKRHDYGLEKLDDDHFTSGMTKDEQVALYNEMDQLYEHHIKQFVDVLFKITYVVQEKDKADAFAKMVLDKYV